MKTKTENGIAVTGGYGEVTIPSLKALAEVEDGYAKTTEL